MQLIWVGLDLLHVDSPTTLAVALLPLLPATNPSTTPRTGYRLLYPYPHHPTTPYYPYYPYYPLRAVPLLPLLPPATPATPRYYP